MEFQSLPSNLVGWIFWTFFWNSKIRIAKRRQWIGRDIARHRMLHEKHTNDIFERRIWNATGYFEHTRKRWVCNIHRTNSQILGEKRRCFTANEIFWSEVDNSWGNFESGNTWKHLPKSINQGLLCLLMRLTKDIGQVCTEEQWEMEAWKNRWERRSYQGYKIQTGNGYLLERPNQLAELEIGEPKNGYKMKLNQKVPRLNPRKHKERSAKSNANDCMYGIALNESLAWHESCSLTLMGGECHEEPRKI